MSRPAHQQGFTIVELLIVIVVIGILAAITVVTYSTIQDRSRIAATSSTLATVKKAMLLYKAQYGELPPTGDAWNYDTNPPSCGYPTTISSLLASSGTATGIEMRDSWGNCLAYDDNDCNSGSAVGAPTYLKSAGPDRITNTADDIETLVSTNGGC